MTGKQKISTRTCVVTAGKKKILKRTYAMTAEEAAIDLGRTKYQRTIHGIHGKKFDEPIDVYSVIAAFEVPAGPVDHALKKLLCAGIRGKGDLVQDYEEIKVALDRAIVQAKTLRDQHGTD